MAMTIDPPAEATVDWSPVRATWQRQRLPASALIAVSAGLGFVVGRDGSPVWQVIRVAVVAVLFGLVWVVLDRGSRVQRAAVAFGAGCLSLPVGLGIAVPHLVKAGLTPVTVAGLLILAGGLVLVGSGGAGLVRATRGWWRALVVPCLLIALMIPLWTLGQAVAVTNVPPTSVGSTTPADRGLSYREVAFDTSDGVRLSGWYVPSANGAAAVLMHGAGSTRSAVLDHASVLARHGFGVLMVDARGHGRSDGRAMDFGWYGDEDASAAVTFLQAQPDVADDRIVAVGMSMGGEQVIGALAADQRIRAAVAEGATNRVAGDKDWLSDEFGWRGALQERIDWLTFGITDLLTVADQPITLRDAVTEARRPLLLIAGEAVENEPHAARHIQAGSPDTVELWIAPDTGHTAALEVHPEEWERRVIEFLTAAMASPQAEAR